MNDWGRWDILILLAASYVAVTSLVRLMSARRDRLVADVQQQLKSRRGQSRKAPVTDES